MKKNPYFLICSCARDMLVIHKINDSIFPSLYTLYR
jgi:hypothetical protein